MFLEKINPWQREKIGTQAPSIINQSYLQATTLGFVPGKTLGFMLGNQYSHCVINLVFVLGN